MVERTPFELGLLVYPGASKAAAWGLTEMWQVANRVAGKAGESPRQHVQISHWEFASGGDIVCTFHSGAARSAEQRLSAVVIPPTLSDLPDDATMQELSRWLRAQHARGALVSSVCGGAYVLAASGLAAGRTITTHWSHRDLLAHRYPTVQVDTDRLIIADGDLISAGGMMAWVDLGLQLVDRFFGTDTMLATARFMLIDPAIRPQSYYATFSPRFDHGDTVILGIQHWLHGVDVKGITLAAMAKKAGLGSRTFLRRFHRATGMNPTEYCQRIKISKSRDLLERSNVTIEQIAWQSGYEDANAYRKVFRKLFGLSPGEYRARFGLSATVDSPGQSLTGP